MQRKHVKRGEVWLCDLSGNIGSEQNGVRPCLVIKTPRKSERTCIILPASRTIRYSSVKAGDYVFVLHQMRVVDASRFKRFIERLTKEQTDSAVCALQKYIDQK